MINYNLKIDTLKEKILSSDISFVTGDVNAYKLIFEFFNGDDLIDISNYILTVRAKRADGVITVGEGKIENNKGIFIPKNSMYSVPGEVILEIALTDSAKNHITAKIITAEVIEGLGVASEPSVDEISVFVTLISQIQSKIETAEELIRQSTPERGIHYWTPDDKEEMIADILAALPIAEEVAY